MHSIFRRAAISLVFVSLPLSAVRLDASPESGEQEHNTLEIVENVPQPDRSILEKAVIPQLARQTKATWLSLIPGEAQAPRLARGIVSIQFTLHSDGTVSAMKIERSAGIVALDRAAWAAIVGSPRTAFPSDMALQSVRMRMVFLYNGEQPSLRPDSVPR
ncbi:energy transducer TonB [Granulicella sp. L60]|uniref:energy transducer TonB n=1 Tax=Granulicella sp. L60 TaxID=1641866 RepID=UPI00131D0811|nr:energy transducer TonB [Granulicella sp. L60]